MKMELPEPFFIFITEGKMISGAPGSPLRQKKLPGGHAFFKQKLGLGQSLDHLKNRFDIRMTRSRHQHQCELQLRPYKVSRRMPYAVIQATIDTRLWLPESIQLVEPGGDAVRFDLTFTAVNTSLPEGIFDIAPSEIPSVTSNGMHETK